MTRAVPVFSPIPFVQRIANIQAAEPHAPGVALDKILRARATDELERRPDLIDCSRIAGWAVSLWHKANNKILNKAPGLYIPSLFVKVERT